MSLLEAIVLGIVQGVTEFLPISSTAHLRVVPAFAGLEDPGAAFTAITQLGTLAAVLIYFRHDLWRVAIAWTASLSRRERRQDFDARLGWYLIAGTVPISVFGLLFEEQIETTARDLTLIGITLIALGLLLLAAERASTHERPMEAVRLRDALIVGLAQGAALVPGVSRAGATLTAGLFLGLQRPAAARFSFLLSIPAITLSGVFQLAEVVRGDAGYDVGFVALAVATLLAFVAGYWAIAFLLRFLANHSTVVFVVYRVALGALVLALVTAGAIR